nr:ABC-three component system middle component 2 [Candidatus Protofrankia californiensis]
MSEGLMMMVRADLVKLEISGAGILYRAGEATNSFIDLLEAPYLVELASRAEWVVAEIDKDEPTGLRARMNGVFGRWSEEFDRSLSDSEGD